MTPAEQDQGRWAEPIAIVGMRGRFPGANDIDQLWENLARGTDSITTLSSEDMRAAGVPDHISRLPGYVNAAPLLDGVEEFDAEFFGYSARDASLTDPQHRIFLETAWEALEDAGYDPASYPGSIGVFGGCELSSYLYQLHLNADSLGYLDGMQLMVTNDKDHLCTQVSYRLDLRGPSVVVQTTCSTSLVAVGMACESLHGGRCDMALAGGVTVRVPQRGGYYYVPGSILSPDGHCRPFDANAQGTIVGSGVGLVVLKRLRDAQADGDHVRGLILGMGINNDGSDKVGYTAPGFRGQAAAIRAAFAASGVSPESVGYVEAHGTGTILGDPIEVAALTEVFRDHTDRRGFCGIGSAKSNFGHLSCASGVTGLIKAVLTLEHGAIPPTVHYKAPNPAIDLAASPFYVTTTLHPWERNGGPRRAGVSSFGVGGTNAHAILEEAPPPQAHDEPEPQRTHQLLVLSARSEAALDAATRRLGAHLDRHPGIDLADAAHTLHVGRRAFPHRRTLVADTRDRAGAVARLLDPKGLASTVASGPRPVVFMFPGQGAQYPGMAGGLYEREPVVREAIDHCAQVLEPLLGLDLRRLLFPDGDGADRPDAAAELRNTSFAQPALFTVEYALAKLWGSWGVQPAAMIGHSIGEYVAATLAGVMSVDDALGLLARRGQLIASLPAGSMLAVMAPAETVEGLVGPLVGGFGDGEVSLAAVNAPGFCVLSGPHPAIERVEAALVGASVVARRLHTSHAFHSSMMDPVLGPFEDVVSKVALSAPTIPYVTSLSGRWADGEPTQPAYWSAQLRSTVRFADGLRSLAQADELLGADPVYLEVGPGRTLVTFAAQRGNGTAAPLLTLASLPGAGEQRSDGEAVLGALGRLWEAGVTVDWKGFHCTERRRRVPLPTYPFERQRYWVGGSKPAAPKAMEARDPSGWFHVPVWQPASAPDAAARSLEGAPVLVFDEGAGLGAEVASQLREAGARPVVVRRGGSFERTGEDAYVMDPAEPDAFGHLAADACRTGRLAGIVDCWSTAPPEGPAGTDLDDAALVTLLGPLRLAHSLSGRNTVRPLPMLLVARGSSRVLEGDVLDPPRAFGIGTAKVLPQEHPGLRVAHVDIPASPGGEGADAPVPDPLLAGLLLTELAAGAPEPELAFRHGQRYVRAYEPVAIPSVAGPAGLPPDPVVMVTGGLGHMGLILAEAMFSRMNARLVLISRAGLPEPGRWRAMSESSQTAGDLRTVLRRLAALRDRRDDVVVLGADLDDPGQVAGAVDAALARFGRIDVVVHGAANVSASAFASAAETGPAVVEAQLSPKIRGLLYLVEAMRGREPQRWVLHSSISAVLGGLALGAYAGANAVLDALALQGGERWLSIAWDAWDNAAEAQMAGMPVAIRPAEGQEAFLRVLGAPVGSHVVVAVDDLAGRIESWVRGTGAPKAKGGGERHPRPNLATAFVEARTDTERELAEILASQLGVASVGVHDRFFDLGGHSLLAVQVASEIRDRFQIEMPVLQLFKAPTVAELAPLVEQAQASGELEASGVAPPAPAPAPLPAVPPGAGAGAQDPGSAAKASYREFYDDVTRRLERSGVGEASFFLNYGYLSQGEGDEARFEVPDGVFNPSSIRLVFELIGPTELGGRRVLDVGCGRGGTVSLLTERFEAEAVGVDLSPEAVAFCRRAHRHPSARFEVGDAEHLPFEDGSFDVVTNVESSHTYPDIRAFLTEVRRVLVADGWFLHTDLLPVGRWIEVCALLGQLGFTIAADRHITPSVLASCDQVAGTRAKAFGDQSALIDNFLAVPGSPVYEQMRSGAWEYRILRSRLDRRG